MPSKWQSTPLPTHEISPEAHWLRTVLEQGGPLQVSLRLSRPEAARLFDTFARKYVKPAPERLSTEDERQSTQQDLYDRLDARLSQSGFELLFWFLRNESDETATVDVELFLPSEAFCELRDLNAVEGLEIRDVGPANSANVDTEIELVVPDDSEVPTKTSFKDEAVVTAIIDDGIGVANRRFGLSKTETRIAYFLDMNPVEAGTPLGPGEGPGGADTDCIGTSWTKEILDRLFDNASYDEAQIYRDMGMIRSQPDRRQPLLYRGTHGTHMLDLAAGEDADQAGAEDRLRERPIIAIQLPSDVVIDRSDSQMAQTLNCALDWLFAKAIELSRRTSKSAEPKTYLPLVLNFSFGIIAGPHDGKGEVEQRLKDFIERYRALPGNPQCEVVLAAGNSLQARAYAQVEARDQGSVTEIPWRVLPDDKTSSFVQIWLPKCGANSASERRKTGQIAVSLVPPQDAPAARTKTKLGEALDWIKDGAVLARLYHQIVRLPTGELRERITIAIRPTATDLCGVPVCPAGLWQIKIHNKSLSSDSKIDLRIQRDDPVAYGRPKGRQSYFDDENYVRFEVNTGRLRNDETRENGPVLRSGTLSAYATGNDPIVVGGFRFSDGTPAYYSSAGPAHPSNKNPDIAAISETSPSHHGVLASGTYTGSVIALNGTSVAAPEITRQIVKAIAAGKSFDDVKKRVAKLETNTANVPAKTPLEILHSEYPPVRPARMGEGRFVPNDVPENRQRIDR